MESINKTDTLNQNPKQPMQKANIFQMPFRTSYNINAQSSIDWSERPKVQETSCNTPSTFYDPTNTQRVINHNKKLDFSNPKLFRKMNGISEFNQITHPFNVNPNKDYVKALEKNKNFRKAKGMCSEFVRLAKSQPR